MELVGRERERNALLEAVRTGPGTALIRGATGVGKTGLVSVVADELERGRWVVERTAGAAAGAGTPFGPFLYLQGVDALPSQSPAEQLVRLGAELRVRAGDDPLVVVVDDAHLLDPASAMLVHHLATRESFGVLLAARTPEPLPDDLAGLVENGHALGLDLEPLHRRHCDELVNRLLGRRVDSEVTDEVWRVSEGNPLFVRELLEASRERGTLARNAHGVWSREGSLGSSKLLRDVIDHRLDHLDDERRALLEALAVAGPLRFQTVEQLLPLDQLASLEGAGLALVTRRGDHDVVDVGHPLYAEITRELGSVARLHLARRRVAAALEGREAPDELFLRARLRLDVGDSDPPLYLAAARAAFGWLDGAFALRCSDAAADGGAGIDAELLRASALGMIGRHHEATAEFSALAARTDDPSQRATVLLQHAQHLLYQEGSVVAASATLRRGIAELTPSAAAPLRSYLAWVMFLSGQPEEAVAVAEPLLDGQAFPVVFGGGPAFASAQAMLGRPALALDVAEHAFAELRTLELGAAMDVTIPANFMWIRILSLWQLGRAAEADDPFAPLRGTTVEPLLDSAIVRHGMHGTQAFVRGHLDVAVAAYDTLGAQLRTGPLPVSAFNAILLATVYALRGDQPSAHEQLAFVDDTLTPGLAIYRWWTERARALAGVASGDIAGA